MTKESRNIPFSHFILHGSQVPLGFKLYLDFLCLLTAATTGHNVLGDLSGER